jgi:hypothetical protein
MFIDKVKEIGVKWFSITETCFLKVEIDEDDNCFPLLDVFLDGSHTKRTGPDDADVSNA